MRASTRLAGRASSGRKASGRSGLATSSPALESAATVRPGLCRRRILLLLLLSESVVGIEWMALWCRRSRASFAVRAVAGILLVRGRSSGIGGRVFGRAVDGWSATSGGSSSSSYRSSGAASTRWDSGRAAFVLARYVLFGQFLLAAALLVGLSLAVFLFLLQLESKGKIVVLLFACAEGWLLVTPLWGWSLVRCWSRTGQWRCGLFRSIVDSQASLLRRSFGSTVASWHCLPSQVTSGRTSLIQAAAIVTVADNPEIAAEEFARCTVDVD